MKSVHQVQVAALLPEPVVFNLQPQARQTTVAASPVVSLAEQQGYQSHFIEDEEWSFVPLTETQNQA